MTGGRVIVIRGDAAHLPLPDAGVDLIVTSPPYWNLRDYRDGGESLKGQIGSEESPQAWLEALLECTREWMRVLKPGGSMFVDLGDKRSARADGSAGRSGRRDHVAVMPAVRNSHQFGRPKSLLLLPERYRIACADQLGLIVRAKIVWSKPAPLPDTATDRVQTSHEDIVHLTLRPRYYADLDPIRVPHSGGTHARRKDGTLSPKEAANVALGHRRGFFPEHRENPKGKIPGSVWDIPSVPLAVPAELETDHFAAFPPALVRRCILGWSPPGGIVADPFGGSGTTALVASVLGRTGITSDLSADYCRIARWRTSDPAERARALGVPKPPPVTTGQGSLFDDLPDTRPA